MTSPGKGTTNVGGVAVPQLPAALGSSSNTESYGVKNLGSVVTIGTGTLGALLGITQPTATAGQILTALSHLSGVAAAQVQQILYNGGYYGNGAKPPANAGVIGSADLTALGRALNENSTQQQVTDQQAAQDGSTSAPPVDFGAEVVGNAQTGEANGIQAAMTQRLQVMQDAQAKFANQTVDVASYDPGALAVTGNRIAQSILGRKLTDAEQAKLYADIGVKSNPQVAKVKAEANKLDAAEKETEQANTNLTNALTTTRTGKVTPSPASVSTGLSAGESADPADFGLINNLAGGPNEPTHRNDYGDLAATNAATVNTDQYLQAYSQQVGTDANPYGFTTATWATAARQAGLGSDADMSNATNQKIVARFLANTYYQRYGSWDAVTAGLSQGATAAAAYAKDPNAARWTQAQPGGSLTSIINSVNAILPTLQGTQVSALDPGATTYGTGTDGSTVTASPVTTDGAAGLGTKVGPITASLEGTTSAMPNLTPVTADQESDQIEADLEKSNPNEAAAHSLTQTFANFLNLLGSGDAVSNLASSAQPN